MFLRFLARSLLAARSCHDMRVYRLVAIESTSWSNLLILSLIARVPCNPYRIPFQRVLITAHGLTCIASVARCLTSDSAQLSSGRAAIPTRHRGSKVYPKNSPKLVFEGRQIRDTCANTALTHEGSIEIFGHSHLGVSG